MLYYPTLANYSPEKIYENHVRGRVVIYLDTSIWIELSDSKTSEAKKCLETCLIAQNKKAAIFPLSCASISELLEQENGDSRTQQARIMDILSEGVTFRPSEEILKIEAEFAAPFLFGEPATGDAKSMAFTYILRYLGEVTSEISFTKINPISVESLAKNLPLERLQEFHKACEAKRLQERKREQAVKELSQKYKLKNGKLDRSSILNNERLYFYENHVFSLVVSTYLQRYGAEALKAKFENALRRFSNGPSRLSDFFHLMPSTELCCEINTARICNPGSKEKPGDFYDDLHADCAPAYSDIFAVQDAALCDFLRNRCQLPRSRGCIVTNGLPELKAAMEEKINTQNGI